MREKIVSIVGGSGFVGKAIAHKLARAGYRINIISRNPERAAGVKTAGNVGQVHLTYADIHNENALRHALANSDIVVNTVGILYESGCHQKFSEIHAQGAERVAQIARDVGASRLIHISALGVDKHSGSYYARSKFTGENAVSNAFPDVTILRPSVIFGPGDKFFNLFAAMSCWSPALPLIGGGKTRFQPIYVEDIAQAVLHAIQKPETAGKIYELGGPETYTFKELLQYVVKVTRRCTLLIPVPFAIATIKAFFLGLMPKPLITKDQVRLLKVDNVVSDKALTLSDLDITPTPLEDIVPHYLQRFAKPL